MSGRCQRGVITIGSSVLTAIGAQRVNTDCTERISFKRNALKSFYQNEVYCFFQKKKFWYHFSCVCIKFNGENLVRFLTLYFLIVQGVQLVKLHQ